MRISSRALIPKPLRDEPAINLVRSIRLETRVQPKKYVFSMLELEVDSYMAHKLTYETSRGGKQFSIRGSLADRLRNAGFHR
jgi:hypothetical protein